MEIDRPTDILSSEVHSANIIESHEGADPMSKLPVVSS